ncbi:hypothetical protein CX676_02450 [Paracoccus zhejiangensis]|uniref:Uncharacterized protein n=2 Tax=Paracoccus zhejiangensis TaxID=1077935 RepID=A0A2H5EV19_9RHOB|nr:hypothetical protein CX676_02450 [Paracoccus zhejiangensis]
MIGGLVLGVPMLAQTSQAETVGLMEAVTGEPMGPMPIIGRIGRPSSGISVGYDNTMMTEADAEAYAIEDCADYDKAPAKLRHQPAQPDAPHLSFVKYTCE